MQSFRNFKTQHSATNTTLNRGIRCKYYLKNFTIKVQIYSIQDLFKSQPFWLQSHVKNCSSVYCFTHVNLMLSYMVSFPVVAGHLNHDDRHIVARIASKCFYSWLKNLWFMTLQSHMKDVDTGDDAARGVIKAGLWVHSLMPSALNQFAGLLAAGSSRGRLAASPCGCAGA